MPKPGRTPSPPQNSSLATHGDAIPLSSQKRRVRWPFERRRAIVVAIVFESIVVGLVLRTGWGTISSFGVDAVATLCPLGALETLVAARTMVPRALIMLVVAIVAIALLGRAFCSWVCPVPPITRFFHPAKSRKAVDEADVPEDAPLPAELHTAVAVSDEPCSVGADGPIPVKAASEELLTAGVASSEPCTAEVASSEPRPAGADGLFPVKAASEEPSPSGFESNEPHPTQIGAGASPQELPAVGGKRDGLQIDSRHGVLLGALVSSAICGFPVFCLVCPVGLSFATVVCVYRLFAEQAPTWSLAVFAGILLVEVVFFRKWCHRLCPLGALMSLVGARAPLGKARVSESVCLRCKGTDCRVCVNECPELLDPHSPSIPECTRCGICVDKCPAHAIRLTKKAPSAPRDAE